jgi:hypothetical protein
MRNPVNVVVAAYLSFQWLQVSMLVFVADFWGFDLSIAQQVQLIDNAPPAVVFQETWSAILVGLACLVVMMFVFRLLAPRISNFRPDVRDFLPQKLLVVYIALWTVSLIAGPFTAGGLSQPLLVVGWLRFVPVGLLYIRWLTQGDATRPLMVTAAIEVVSGFLGYFSAFRNIFFILGVVTLSLHHVLGRRAIKTLSIASVVVILLGGFWTAIKPAYREALNLGTSSQEVLLSVADRFALLGDFASRLSVSSTVDGLVGMAMRIEYVDYLAQAMQNVPAIVPYENGALWGEAFANLIPRILFPDKPVLPSDSERTGRYILTHIASEQEGTSISMGYVADSYIDFGIIGPFVVSALLGAFYALMARGIVRLNRDPELSVVIVVLAVMFFPIQDFGISNVQLLGGVLWNWIVCSIFVRYLWLMMRRFSTRLELQSA